MSAKVIVPWSYIIYKFWSNVVMMMMSFASLYLCLAWEDSLATKVKIWLKSTWRLMLMLMLTLMQASMLVLITCTTYNPPPPNPPPSNGRIPRPWPPPLAKEVLAAAVVACHGKIQRIIKTYRKYKVLKIQNTCNSYIAATIEYFETLWTWQWQIFNITHILFWNRENKICWI